MTAFDDRADVIVDQVNSDEGVANRIAVLCLNNGFEPSTGQQDARRIMGNNIFGIEEAIKHFGVAPTKRQLAYMAEVPYSEATLIACKDTHILAAVFRLSGMEVREKAKSQKVFCQQDWYDNQPFAHDKGMLEWQFVRKTPVDDSTRKTWDEQQFLLDKSEETPKFQVLAYTVVGHFLATGERLFEGAYVRCADLDSDGNLVLLRFDPDGLSVNNYHDGARDGSIAVSSARKQES